MGGIGQNLQLQSDGSEIVCAIRAPHKTYACQILWKDMSYFASYGKKRVCQTLKIWVYQCLWATPACGPWGPAIYKLPMLINSIYGWSKVWLLLIQIWLPNIQSMALTWSSVITSWCYSVSNCGFNMILCHHLMMLQCLKLHLYIIPTKSYTWQIHVFFVSSDINPCVVL